MPSPLRIARLASFAALLALTLVPRTNGQPDLENTSTPPPPPTITADVLASRPTAPPSGLPPTTPPDTTELLSQLELLYDFLSLPPEHLKRIQRTLSLIERLSPEERAKMRQRLARMQLDLDRSEKALSPFSKYLQGVERLEFRRYWISLKAARQDRLIREFNQTKEAQRPAWIQKQLKDYRQHQDTVQQRLRNALPRPEPPPDK